MLCNHRAGMPEHQRPAVASQPELLLKSMGAVSALEDSEFQRHIVQKVFFAFFFYLFVLFIN